MSNQTESTTTGHLPSDDQPIQTTPQAKQPFTPPKLTFVAPKLVKRGGSDDILQGSFISAEFSPGG